MASFLYSSDKRSQSECNYITSTRFTPCSIFLRIKVRGFFNRNNKDADWKNAEFHIVKQTSRKKNPTTNHKIPALTLLNTGNEARGYTTHIVL